MLALGAKAQKPILKAEAGVSVYAAVAADPTGYFTTTYKGGIVQFDISNPYTEPVNRICQESEMILAGTLVKNDETGNKYYAMFADAQGVPTSFCTVDFASGKKTKLGDASKLVNMFYDEANKVLYGLGLTDNGGSKLYSIDVQTGALTEKGAFEGVRFVAGCMTGSDKVRVIATNNNMYMLTTSASPVTSSKVGTMMNPKTNRLVKIEEAGQSLFYKGTTMYWLGYGNVDNTKDPESFIARIDLVNREVSKLGDLDKAFGGGKIRLTGMCFDLTSQAGASESGEDFYFSILNNDIEMEGGLFKSNMSDPYKTKKIANYDDYLGYGFCAATAVNGTYYAMRWDGAYRTAKDFCTVNLQTGEVTSLGTVDKIIKSMTYDAKNKIMYGVESIEEEVDNGPSELKTEIKTTSIIYSINLTNGALTKVCEFNNGFVGLFAAKDGSIYAMDEFKIYLLNLKNASSEEVMTFSDIKPDRQHGQSIVSLRNDFYWLVNGYENKVGPRGFLAKINLADKTITKVGNGSDKYPSNTQYSGLYIIQKSITSNMISKITSFGDAMGSRPMTEASTIETYYYNEKNQISRVALGGYGYDASKDIFFPMNYKVYEYNDKDQLVKSYQRGWKQQGMETKYNAPNMISVYEYDEKGNLVKLDNTADQKRYYLYEYDAFGNKIKEEAHSNNGSWYTLYTYTFSDFIPGVKNCPLKIESTGPYDNDFIGEYTYDDFFNMTSYTTYDTEKTPKSKKEWIYNEDGKLIKTISYRVNGAKEFVVNSTVNYVIKDDNNTEERGESLSYKLLTRDTFIGETAPTNLQIKNVSTATSPNSFELTCDAPENVIIPAQTYYVYRDGIKVGAVNTLDANGKIKFVDKEVPNDMLHDWFIQTVDEAANHGYNISNIVKQEDLQTELVPVTDIKIDSYVTGEVKPELGSSYTGTYVTLSWNAPDSQFPLLGYNVYVGSAAKAANNVMLTEPTGTVVFGVVEYDDAWKNTVTVEACYSIGRIRVTDEFNLKAWESISEINIASLLEINGKQLTIKGEYTSLDMYNTNGSAVISVNGVSNVDLSSLQAGIYLIRLNQDGKTSTLKTVIK